MKVIAQSTVASRVPYTHIGYTAASIRDGTGIVVVALTLVAIVLALVVKLIRLR